MANERPIEPAGVPNDEDEDLFDFPIIEMTLEGLQERTPGSGARPLSGPMQPAPAAPLPKPAGAPATSPTLGSAPPTDVKSAGAPKPAPAPRAQPAPKVAPPAKVAPATKAPQPVAAAKPTPVAAAVAPEIAPETEELVEVAPAPRRSMRLRGVRIAMLLLLALNVTGFWFLWRTHSTLKAGLDDLHGQIDDAALRLERARRDALGHNTGTFTGGGQGLDAVDALERTAIDLAMGEIRAGDYGAARRRLSRLLVRAERMSPGLRAEIEPRAEFLIAHSYHDEALARTGAKQ